MWALLPPGISLSLSLSLDIIMCHKSQSGSGRASGRGLRWGRNVGIGGRLTVCRLGRLVDRMGSGRANGWQPNSNVVSVSMTVVSERFGRTRRCFVAGAMVRGGATQESSETPVELHTHTHTSF